VRRTAIPAVTLSVCSTENLGRSADQVAGILQAVEEKLRSLARAPQIHHNRVRMQAIGRVDDLLPPQHARGDPRGSGFNLRWWTQP